MFPAIWAPQLVAHLTSLQSTQGQLSKVDNRTLRIRHLVGLLSLLCPALQSAHSIQAELEERKAAVAGLLSALEEVGPHATSEQNLCLRKHIELHQML